MRHIFVVCMILHFFNGNLMVILAGREVICVTDVQKSKWQYL